MKDFLIKAEQEIFNSKKGLKEVQLKDPSTCEHYKEFGCIKDMCTCNTGPKQETLEEVAERLIPVITRSTPFGSKFKWEPRKERKAFIEGAKWQQERMYSYEEVLRIIKECKAYLSFGDEFDEIKWFEQFKKK